MTKTLTGNVMIIDSGFDNPPDWSYPVTVDTNFKLTSNNEKVFKMARPTRKYTKEFKQESVSSALKSPSIMKAATELGIPVATLYSRVYQLSRLIQL